VTAVRRLGAAAAGVVVLATGCGTPATPDAVSSSFAEVFAGLYLGQQAALGRTDLTRASLQARSHCRRHGTKAQGPGEDWLCLVQFVDADTATTQSFELQVKPDGCWKAEGPPTSQPAMLADPLTGRLSVNQLAEFDGCLDTSWH
jgi:hypothetical protein